MFNTAELGQSVSDSDFKRRERRLRKQLLDLQARVRESDAFPILIDFAGVRGAGKATTTNVLNKWMNPRWIRTNGYAKPADLELQRPELWRFWRDLPARGEIGISLSGRYSRPLLDYVHQRISSELFLRHLERINRFEQALADDGALILKYWMHISSDVQEKRLRGLEMDPLLSWQMAEEDWENWKLYDRFIEAAEQIIAYTGMGHAPWTIVEGEDFNYRSLQVGESVRDAMKLHLARTELRDEYSARLSSEVSDLEDEAGESVAEDAATLFDHLDLGLKVGGKAYTSQLAERQARLARLHQAAVQQGRSSALVFEGPDAAGKGGSIRRITDVLDAHRYRIYSIAAPTEEELAHHYLWRFWRKLPRAGHMVIFDRSWYGRVLVERIEGFARADEWQRAYAEINDFEQQMVDHGIVLLKFWLHIDKTEQLSRFEARKETPHKQWKLTGEDWRNHERAEAYQLAAHEMIQKTSMQSTPWVVVESQDKKYGRIKVLDAVCEAFEEALDSG